jgi:hypothetical protein
VVNDTGNFDEEWVLLTFGGKPQQITADKEEKLTRSRLHPTSSLVSTAVPPKVSKTPEKCSTFTLFTISLINGL